MWAQRYKLTAISRDGKETWEPDGKLYPRSDKPQPQPRAPHMLDTKTVAWFQSTKGGKRKDIRTLEDLKKLSPEESDNYLEALKKNPELRSGLEVILQSLAPQGAQQGGGYDVPPKDVE